jgi:hypothetical protein
MRIRGNSVGSNYAPLPDVKRLNSKGSDERQSRHSPSPTSAGTILAADQPRLRVAHDVDRGSGLQLECPDVPCDLNHARSAIDRDGVKLRASNGG